MPFTLRALLNGGRHCLSLPINSRSLLPGKPGLPRDSSEQASRSIRLIGAAEKWVNTVFRKVKEPGAFPESGRIVPEIDNKAIRELICGNYSIVYRLEKKTMFILAVRHGKQVLPVDGIEE